AVGCGDGLLPRQRPAAAATPAVAATAVGCGDGLLPGQRPAVAATAVGCGDGLLPGQRPAVAATAVGCGDGLLPRQRPAAAATACCQGCDHGWGHGRGCAHRLRDASLVDALPGQASICEAPGVRGD